MARRATGQVVERNRRGSRTFALRFQAELGEHPAITAAQMGHRDPRMTLRVYTDVTGLQPKTRMVGLLHPGKWSVHKPQE
jgi:hypothetical protein